MAGAERPLSPHVQTYRWRITMATSIMHRITGLALAAGTLLLAWWLLAAASGPEAFAALNAVLAHWLGRLALFGFSWALLYHLSNGIRHLFWDAGLGFDVRTATRTGWAALFGSLLLTLIAWAFGYGMLGG
ncbi:MAG: succinate dehydrogenase, cytochrome b556 subunit [Sphingomonadales bacterium]